MAKKTVKKKTPAGNSATGKSAKGATARRKTKGGTDSGKTASRPGKAAKRISAGKKSTKRPRGATQRAGGPKSKKTTMEMPAAKSTSSDALRDMNGNLQEPTKSRKCPLAPEQLEEFHQLLLHKRAELMGTVTQLRDESLRKSRQESAGDLSSMPIHMADIGSDNWEQEFTLGLLANEKGLIREIDEALDRIEKGTYGICLATHKPIQKRRLRAQPWAKHCIQHARELELQRNRGADRD